MYYKLNSYYPLLSLFLLEVGYLRIPMGLVDGLFHPDPFKVFFSQAVSIIMVQMWTTSFGNLLLLW
jgi:hypothetical protein